MEIVDLSVVLDEHTPVYPGDPETIIKPAGILANDGYQDHYVSFGNHVGTHMDAPAHMIEGGKNLDEYPVDRFVGRGKLIAVHNDFSLQDVKASNLQPGDIVLFYTGLSDKYRQPTYFKDYPALPQKIAEFLVEKQVSIVGLDTCSPDHDEFVAHRTLLGGDVLIIENLSNLGRLAGKEFTVHALPIKMPLDGAPCRVIATIY